MQALSMEKETTRNLIAIANLRYWYINIANKKSNTITEKKCNHENIIYEHAPQKYWCID